LAKSATLLQTESGEASLPETLQAQATDILLNSYWLRRSQQLNPAKDRKICVLLLNQRREQSHCDSLSSGA